VGRCLHENEREGDQNRRFRSRSHGKYIASSGKEGSYSIELPQLLASVEMHVTLSNDTAACYPSITTPLRASPMNCEDFSLSTERASRQTKSSLLLTFHFVVELEDDPNLKVIKLPSVPRQSPPERIREGRLTSMSDIQLDVIMIGTGFAL
jgi:hypothetical protein